MKNGLNLDFFGRERKRSSNMARVFVTKTEDSYFVLEQSPPKDDSVTPFSKESDCCREPSQSLDYVSPNLF